MKKSLVKTFKALSDETRFQIAEILLKSEKKAGDFEKYFNKEQSTISRHLKELTQAEIISFKKEGKNYIYQIKNQKAKNQLKNFGLKPRKN